MAFDGTVIANLVRDMNENIIDGRIAKIAQPENDELLLTINKRQGGSIRLILSANASLPLAYFTDTNKQAPMTAPNFCMLLRKHIANGRITKVTQPDMERIIKFEIEHYNDLGDLCTKYIYIELMGKHSNIIFCDDKNMILDSIKHISAQMSSLREVLPGRDYFYPKTSDKKDPLMTNEDEFIELISAKPMGLQKALYQTYNGISPLIASELCFRSGLDNDSAANCQSMDNLKHLYNHFSWMMDDIRNGKFEPVIVYNGKEPVEFASFMLEQYKDYDIRKYNTISEVLKSYYSDKETYSRIRQKSVDLRKVVSNAIDRTRRKYDLQLKQMKDTEKRDKYKVYGELINTYGYGISPDAKSFEALNYYTNEMITIPLDNMLTPQENAQKYFEKYNKLKRTSEALSEQTATSKAELEHLESIETALKIAITEADLAQIKEELTESGYIKKHQTGKKQRIQKSKPFHYISSDGFDIYVGKNNLQNDELTFKVANGGDWWFHAKKMPGSHVIVKTGGREMTDKVYEEAGALAAYYSNGRESDKVEIDYLQRKNVKKPNGSKPGFVVYYTNYSLNATPDISNLTLVNE